MTFSPNDHMFNFDPNTEKWNWDIKKSPVNIGPWSTKIQKPGFGKKQEWI